MIINQTRTGKNENTRSANTIRFPIKKWNLSSVLGITGILPTLRYLNGRLREEKKLPVIPKTFSQFHPSTDNLVSSAERVWMRIPVLGD